MKIDELFCFGVLGGPKALGPYASKLHMVIKEGGPNPLGPLLSYIPPKILYPSFILTPINKTLFFSQLSVCWGIGITAIIFLLFRSTSDMIYVRRISRTLLYILIL